MVIRDLLKHIRITFINPLSDKCLEVSNLFTSRCLMFLRGKQNYRNILLCYTDIKTALCLNKKYLFFYLIFLLTIFGIKLFALFISDINIEMMASEKT